MNSLASDLLARLPTMTDEEKRLGLESIAELGRQMVAARWRPLLSTIPFRQ